MQAFLGEVQTFIWDRIKCNESNIGQGLEYSSKGWCICTRIFQYSLDILFLLLLYQILRDLRNLKSLCFKSK